MQRQREGCHALFPRLLARRLCISRERGGNAQGAGRLARQLEATDRRLGPPRPSDAPRADRTTAMSPIREEPTVQQYLDLLRYIRANGVRKPTRTVSSATGRPLDAFAVFGYQ